MLGISHWTDWLVMAVLVVALGGSVQFMRSFAYLRGCRDMLNEFRALANTHLIMCGACGEQFHVEDQDQVIPAMTLHAERDCRGAP